MLGAKISISGFVRWEKVIFLLFPGEIFQWIHFLNVLIKPVHLPYPNLLGSFFTSSAFRPAVRDGHWWQKLGFLSIFSPQSYVFWNSSNLSIFGTPGGSNVCDCKKSGNVILSTIFFVTGETSLSTWRKTFVLDDPWSKKICRPEMIVWSLVILS